MDTERGGACCGHSLQGTCGLGQGRSASPQAGCPGLGFLSTLLNFLQQCILSALLESHTTHAWVLYTGTRAAPFSTPEDIVSWRFMWYNVPLLALLHPSKQVRECQLSSHALSLKWEITEHLKSELVGLRQI